MSAATASTMGAVGAGTSARVSVSQESGGVVDDGAVPSMVAGAGVDAGAGAGTEVGLRGRGSITITCHAALCVCCGMFVLCVA
jgi:hypothetical protein